MTPPVRLGVVGLGFMGQTHVRAINAARAAGLAVDLVAVADSDASRLSGFAGGEGNLAAGSAGERLFDPAIVAVHAKPADLLARRDLDAVVIATPTDTHERLVASALAAGLHALVEKPIALDVASIDRLAHAERAAGRRVVPAMVMRHWPGWPWLRAQIASRTYGDLRALRLTRLGCRPGWSSFYHDATRCGGALVDLHIHDADFVLHALGAPSAVLAVGGIDHVHTLYRFERGPAIVAAEGGWVADAGRGFRMRYAAEFDDATVEFDLASSPTVRVLRNGEIEHPSMPSLGGYDDQLRHFAACVAGWRSGQAGDPTATLDDARRVTMLLDAERRSLEHNAWVRLPVGLSGEKEACE